MPHVVSALSSTVDYTLFEPGRDGGPHVEKKRVRIRGGHGVANKHHVLAAGVLTPDGVATKVSEEDLAFLLTNPQFQHHLEHGHVKILKSNSQPNTASVSRDMAKNDSSRPLVDADFEEGGRAAMPKLPEGETWGVKTSTIQ